MTRTRTRFLAALALPALVVALLAGGCSDETADTARSAAESAGDDIREGAKEAGDAVGDAADQAGAVAAAEDLRARIKANDTADEEGLRSVAAINESASDVVGSPTVSGVDDGDGDGLDDDGKVQVEVGGESACVTLPASGDDTSVDRGTC